MRRGRGRGMRRVGTPGVVLGVRAVVVPTGAGAQGLLENLQNAHEAITSSKHHLPPRKILKKCYYHPELASFSPNKLMRQLKMVGPGPLGHLAPVGMPKWVAPIGCCKARPSAMVFACGRLWCHGAAGVVARRRLGTRLGLAGGGPIAFALPAHARAAGTQNPGRVCPQEPFQQP